MKSAGISDSESGSNAKLPLPRRSPASASPTKGLRSARRLTTTTSKASLRTKDGRSLVVAEAPPAIVVDHFPQAPKDTQQQRQDNSRPESSSTTTTISSAASSREPTPTSLTRTSRSRGQYGRHPDFLTLNIGTLTGRFSLQVHNADDVGDVKRRIQECEGIPMQSQILLWGDKALADDASPIAAFGIQDGSSLRLVLHMSSGSGPPLKVKSAEKEDDPVVLLLCKEDDDMYMLEFHMAESTKDNKQPNRKRLLQLAELAGLEIFHDLSGDASSLIMRSLQNTDGDYVSMRGMVRTAPESVREDESVDRPDSGDTGSTTSTFKSMCSSAYTVGGRPISPLSDSTSRPSSGESAMGELFGGMFGSNSTVGSRSRIFGVVPKTARRRVRPATAISVMRIPGGGGPMIVIPKARPASAIQLAKRRSVMDDTPPSTPPGGSQRKNHGGKPASPVVARAKQQRARSARPLTTRSHKLGGGSTHTISPTAPPPTCEHVDEFISTAVSGRVSRIVNTTAVRRQSGDGATSGGAGEKQQGSQANINRPRSKRESRQMPPRTPISSVVVARRCALCKKKIGPATSFKCRCTQVFCSVHRYSDRHGCTYDYRGAGRIALAKENPLIKKDKLEKL